MRCGSSKTPSWNWRNFCSRKRKTFRKKNHRRRKQKNRCRTFQEMRKIVQNSTITMPVQFNLGTLRTSFEGGNRRRAGPDLNTNFDYRMWGLV